jgi:DNA-binding CsgD family transcriptional regulator/tetratricopeptide (TPR) repeat protein
MIGPVVRRISSSIFVGRVAERAQLGACLDAAEQREPGLVLLGGEAGIGKTRLATELATIAGTRGALVLRGHCLEARAASLPFAPFIEILRGLLLGEHAYRNLEMGEPARAVLARLVPEIEPQPAVERRPPTEGERLRLFYAVLELFGRTAEDRPLLVVVEDLHWADASSLDLLRFIAGDLASQRLLILGTFRTDDLHHRHPLLPLIAELVRLPHVIRLDLPPFTEPEVADQLTGIARSRPADDVVQRIFARSDGNPFFVEELSGHGADTRLPTTLRDVLAARLATLSGNARAVVLAAAAIGREAPHELIAQVAAVAQEQLLDALREAIDHHVLVRTDPHGPAGFAFRHALIQELAYAELLPSERIALHRAIVRSLQGAGGSSGEIARHASLGHDPPTGRIYSVRAADQAFVALAFADALTQVERALELWSAVSGPEALTGRDEATLLTLAAHCAAALGRWSHAAELGRTALAQLDPIERRDVRIVALLDMARWALNADDEVARAAAVLEAADLVPADPSALRARVLTDLAHLANHSGRVDEARRLAEEAIEISRAIGARAEEARALVRLADTLAGGLLQPEAAERFLAEAERIAAELHAPSEDFVGHLAFRQADFATMTGAFARAVEIVDSGIARASRAGRFGERSGFLRAIKIAALASLGRWDEAETLVDEAGRDAAVVTARMAVQCFVEVLVRQGRIAEAAAAVRATDFGYVTPHEGSWILQTRIRVANGEGRWDDARAAADEAIGLFEDPARGFNVLSILELSVCGEADRAEVAHGRRRTAEAAEARRVGLARLDLARRGARLAIEMGGAGPLIEAELAMAEAEGSRLEGPPDAERWEDAARRREALQQPWEIAYARFRQAEAILVARGRKHEALPLLHEAHRIASRLGARPLVDQIERLAHRGRIRLASAPAERRARQATTQDGVVVALTTREWEVLCLVASGHTNREIGEELFISEKTASVHITNAMDKLGALSRYDAAASATRLGLLDATPGGRATH